MKRILLLFSIIIIVALSHSRINTTPIEPTLRPVNIELEMAKDGAIFKNDMREAILEFADENTPADSLYMPDFLQ